MKQQNSDLNAEFTPKTQHYRGLWVILGSVVVVLINLLAALGMTGFVMFGFSQFQDVKRAAHFTYDSFCVVLSVIGAVALLVVAGACIFWIINQTRRRIIIAGTVVAALACLLHGILFGKSPLTGSQDFRAMEGLGKALLAIISVTISITITITNVVFLWCTSNPKTTQLN